ncbi:hypothetical protein E7T06_20120 [Deinococcus sp. Arct2-2]|uniref:hypothetical protein n=1 Tax=Deinococcus sp. Arct2-2 TaxID=2568653 RepID=UPI0010A34A3F|nr:hypothetical protein [Deinococcus sp. Arct2-2]THF67608.1 hypothetical protein E7T06_20120 [Deinococcus sp. Arct2-2]
MDYSELRQHLAFFTDAVGFDEVKGLYKDRIDFGSTHLVLKDLNYLDQFIASNPDKVLLREFIAYEMNLDFSDPTGEADFQWLIGARDTIRAALAEAGHRVTASP